MGFFTAVKKFFGKSEEVIQTDKNILEKDEIASADHIIQTEETFTFPEHESGQSVDLPENEKGTDIFISVPAKESIFAEQNVNEEKDISTSENPIIAGQEEEIDQDIINHPISKREETKFQSSGNDEILVRLRGAPQKLSSWLEIILENVPGAGELLWERLDFLLSALEAPEDERRKFVEDFKKWLERMEYVHIDEFRSELQYQLALALDLEDEEDERNRLFIKFNEGLSRTRAQLAHQLDSLFGSQGELDEKFWEELEELFIIADLGYEPALELTMRLKQRARQEKIGSRQEIRNLLYKEIEEIFYHPRKISAVNPPEIILMVGVNGAGKTTTIAKLAHRAKMQGKKVLIAAGDTFRAAAIEQLEIWAKRCGADFYAKAAGSDPASVAYEAVDQALKNGIDMVFIDTAGRLQTKTNLMQELGKIRQVLAKKHPGAPHRCILVVDATTGQNAISQAKLFKESAGADELILTKLDGTAKGGVAIAIAMQENLPITYVGLGEKMEDLRPFNGEDYAGALLGEPNKKAA